jgi:putative hydrolase of the HAD superfamily
MKDPPVPAVTIQRAVRDGAGPPPRARGLLLDIGGVVLTPAPILLRRLASGHAGLAALLDSWGGPDGDELWRRTLSGAVSEREYWSRRCTELGPVLGTSGTVREVMGLLYGGPPDVWLQAHVLRLMQDARAVGVPVAALTNDMAAFHGRQWVEDQNWLRLFDVVVDGSRTGVLKPDPRAFAAAASAIGLPPEDLIFLDDMPRNVDGGRRVGLQAIQVIHDDPARAVIQARERLGLTVLTDRT